jgi:dihydroxy-acid dehydratase
MRSQDLRKLGPEIDSLQLSMDWSMEDLDLPQVMVDDVWGDALPGSYHLNELSDAVSRGTYASGSMPSFPSPYVRRHRGHRGMNYSLLSRRYAIWWKCGGPSMDAMVLLSSCDKACSPHKYGANGLLTIHVPGGTMMEEPGMFTLEQVGCICQHKRGQIKQENTVSFSATLSTENAARSGHREHHAVALRR